MTKKTTTALQIDINKIEVNTELTKDDLIAVAVSHYEQGLLAQRDELQKTIAAARKELKTKYAGRDSLIKAVVIAEYADKAAAVVNAIAALGKKATFKTRWVFINEQEWNDPKIPEVKGYLGINSTNNCYEFVSNDFDFPLSGDILVEQNEINALDDKLIEHMEEMTEVRKGLNGISTKERQVKASFAVNLLQNDEKGKALLASIMNSDSPFPMLT
tara:strand:- start:125963 stop:126610 length:648 start_codon:yes stop_codon:yes gene_type:complete